MTSEARLRELLGAATPGPWRPESGLVTAQSIVEWDKRTVVASYETDREGSVDAALIVAAVNELPKLLAVVAAARAVITPEDPEDVLPDDEWAPEFLALRAALAALDETAKVR